MRKNEINIENSDTIKIPIKKIKNPWILATIILVVISLFLFYNSSFMASKKYQSDSISGEEAGKVMVDFLNSRSEDVKVSYLSYRDLGSIYEITVNFKGDSIPTFITTDGKYFIQAAIPLDQLEANPTNTSPENN